MIKNNTNVLVILHFHIYKVKPVLSSHSKRRPKFFFKTNYCSMPVKVLQNALREHYAILLTFIKLPFVFKILVSSFFEWPLKTGFTVTSYIHFQVLFLYHSCFS